MSQESAGAVRVRFAAFEADLRTGELLRRGARVHVQEKPFQILVALLEQPGEVVSRGELCARLWPDERFLDFEDSLNTAVQKLRHALNDSAAAPRYVETVPRRGYRYIGPLPSPAGTDGRPMSSPEDVGPGADAAHGMAHRFWRARWVWSSVAIVAAVLGAFGFGRWARRGRPESLRLTVTMPLTSSAGLEERPTWSPDGTRIAYASDRLGAMDIWVSQVAQPEPVVLTREHGGYDGSPAWSPDGRWIAFASDRLGGGIFVMSPLGGNPQRVAPVRFVPAVELLGSVPTIAWSPDSRELVWAHGITDGRGLWRVSITGGGPREIPLADDIAPFAAIEPAWSFDGRRIAFVEVSGSARTTARIWTVRADGGDPLPLTDGTHFDRQPVWCSDGRRLFFLSDRGGSFDIWSLEVDGGGRPRGQPKQVSAGIGVGSLALSPDCRRVAYSQRSEHSNLFAWSLDAAMGVEGESAEPRVLTSGTQIIEAVDVSADGEWIVFDWSRAGNSDIWAMRKDGTALHQVTRHPADDWRPSLSPDATQVVFHSLRDGNRNLFVAPLAGGATRRLTSHPATDWLPQWSPDGDSIAFVSDRAGSEDIWLLPAEGGEAVQLTRDPRQEHNPVWSTDGTRILFASNRMGRTELLVVPREGGEAQRFCDFTALDAVPLQWLADGSVLTWAAREEGSGSEAELLRIDEQGARPLLPKLPRGHRVAAGLATDGETLYLPLWEQTGDLWLGNVAGPE